MTNEQISKSLVQCFAFDSCEKCSYKPKKEDEMVCMNRLMKDAYDLINRQQAEIERCHKEFEELNILEEEERKEALERARKESALFKGMVDYAISEAIKEFAEKLKKYQYKASSNWSGITTTSKVVDVYVIDNLVKEMVGAE